MYIHTHESSQLHLLLSFLLDCIHSYLTCSALHTRMSYYVDNIILCVQFTYMIVIIIDIGRVSTERSWLHWQLKMWRMADVTTAMATLMRWRQQHLQPWMMGLRYYKDWLKNSPRSSKYHIVLQGSPQNSRVELCSSKKDLKILLHSVKKRLKEISRVL